MTTATAVTTAEERVHALIESSARGEKVTHAQIQAAREDVQRAKTDAEIQDAIERARIRHGHEQEVAAHLKLAAELSDAVDQAYLREEEVRANVSATIAAVNKALEEYSKVVSEVSEARYAAEMHNAMVQDPHTANPLLKTAQGTGKPMVRNIRLRQPLPNSDWTVFLRRGNAAANDYHQTLPPY
ncbi:hypothetical protein [Rhodanobacter sp. OR87]|uniref:hypothetical protein n=1 Tax=Rhodanobacter sp. OR87 TaxID=1076523 RepID=UPI0012DD00FC|nr:hypothetical protein [Rhodanobacter sp. OR87]